jgi:hypothetical protein
MFPLSATHYMELVNIRDPRQRQDVARVMEELSSFATLPARKLVIRYELDEILTRTLGPPAIQPVSRSVIGKGFAWAFGIRGGFHVRAPEGDVTERVREQIGRDKFDATIAAAESWLERAVLAGPADINVELLRSYGWNPEAIRQVAEARAAEERAQVARLDANPRWRRGRLRDVIMAREVIIELFDLLSEELKERRSDFADVWMDKRAVRELISSMPSTDIAVTLKTAAHRNRDKRWLPNDIFDIDALSVAVPYCGIVVTEKHAHHVLTTERVADRTGTILLRRLGDLTDYL